MIPAEAVEAAANAILAAGNYASRWEDLPVFMQNQFTRDARIALEAAAPYMLSHEREQTRLAHLDAMVNRETRQAELAEAFAYGWREGKGIPTPVNVDTQEILHHEAQQPTWNFYEDGIDDE